MAIVFSDITTYKSFDNDHLYRTRVRKMKDHDGPGHFTILFSQLIIIWLHLTKDTEPHALTEIVDKDILKIYSVKMIHSLNDIIRRFQETDTKSISLHYNTFRLIKTDTICNELMELKCAISHL